MRRHAKEEAAFHLYGPGASYQGLSWDERRHLMEHMKSGPSGGGSGRGPAVPSGHGHSKAGGEAVAHDNGKQPDEAAHEVSPQAAMASRGGAGGSSPSKTQRQRTPTSYYNTTRAAPAPQVRVPPPRPKHHYYGHPLRGRGDDAAQAPYHIRYGVHNATAARAAATAAVTAAATADAAPVGSPAPPSAPPTPRSGTAAVACDGEPPAAVIFTSGSGPEHQTACEAVEGAPETFPQSVVVVGVSEPVPVAAYGAAALATEAPEATADAAAEVTDAAYPADAVEGNAKVLATARHAQRLAISDGGGATPSTGAGTAATAAGDTGTWTAEAEEAEEEAIRSAAATGEINRGHTHRGHRAGRRHRRGGGGGGDDSHADVTDSRDVEGEQQAAA